VFDPDRRHLIAYLAAAAVLVVIVARFVGRDSGSHPVPSISMAAPASASPGGQRPRAAPPPRQRRLIWVDVAGAVRRPGLYSLPAGARVAAALERAGGARARANRAAVNLAAKLADGQQVFVPMQGRGGEATPAAGGGGAAGAAAGSAVGAPGVDASGASISGAGAGGPAGGATAGARISLSNATQAQLEQLDGIGPALAQRIIQYRQQHGGFRSIDELKQVSGIGDKRFETLRKALRP
jgi:competence protein ComEA